jgi:uncharacterized repeat protein (TIGR01451 family)/gliding motility-associated-like protein
MKKLTIAILLLFLSFVCGSWIYVNELRADHIEMSEIVRPEEGGPNGIISFHLTNGAVAPSDITITYSVNATVTDPAVNGVDYTTLTGTITIKAGSNEQQLTIDVVDDLLIEGDESIEIGLLSATDAGGMVYLGTQRTLTSKLIDNDNRLKITRHLDGQELGGGNASNGEFMISLPGTLTFPEAIRVKYTIDGASTATGGAGTTFDYDNSTLTGEIVLPANANSIPLPIKVNDDLIAEPTETVLVTLQNVSLSTSGAMTFAADPANTSATVNIIDDDVNVPIGILSTTNGKEPGGTGNDGSFTIGWPNGVNATGVVIVRYTITGTATNGTDYNTITLTRNIPAGSSSVQVPVTVKDDNLVEGPETVILTITGFTVGAGVPALTMGTAVGTVTIADDDVMSSKQWKSARYTGTAVKAGQSIEYTIHVRNTGNVALGPVKITDVVPANTTYASADDGAQPDATGTITWQINTVPVNTTVTKTFTVTVANDLTGVSNITNTGDVNNGDGTGDHPTTPPDPTNPNEPHANPNPNDPATDIPVDNGGKQSVNWKHATYTATGDGGKLRPGDEITYYVHVRNTGHVKLTGVVISDLIPAYTSFVSAANGGVYAGGKVTWPATDINVGAGDVVVSFKVKVVNDLTGAVSITNTAGVNNGDGSGDHPTTPPDQNNPNEPKTNPDPNDPSTDIPVDNAMKSLNWKSAAYTGTGANGMVKAGDEITYTIHVRNTGSVKLDKVIITDVIPAFTTLVMADDNIQTDANGKLTWVVMDVAVGAPDVIKQFTVKVVPDLTNAGYITNTGYVDNGNGGEKPTTPPDPNNPDEPMTNPDPNDPSTEIPVDNGKASLNWKSAAYTASGPKGGVTTGDEITYTIHIRNTGSAKLVNVKIADMIPAFTELVSAEGDIKAVNGQLTWVVPEIAVGGADATRWFKVRVSADLTGATAITNTAQVDNGDGKGEHPTTAADPNDPDQPATNPPPGPSTNIAVDPVVNWVTWKLATTASNREKVMPGEELTYKIYVRNTGNVTIENITVTDPVPAYTTFVSADAGGAFSDGSVVWQITQLGVGNTAEVSMVVRTIDNLDSVPVISNIAGVTDGTDTKSTAGCDPAVDGCSGEPGTYTQTRPVQYLAFANAMSPNGDGKNDFFVIKGLEKLPPATLYMFNRWGDMVYRKVGYNNEWDGAGLSEGVYYYKLEVDEGEGKVQYTGWVILKRK